MKKQDVKVGMKVVPFKKTAKRWMRLSLSSEWKLGKKQGFLKVIEWDAKEGCWVLGARSAGSPTTGGDFFNSGDFRPYKPSKVK